MYNTVFSESGSPVKPAERRFAEDWGWYPSLLALCGGDLLHLDKATKVPVHQAMTFLAYTASKNELERKLLKSEASI